MYKCKIISNSTRARYYDVETKSAMKAADELGRCESGEIVTVYRPKSGKIVSRVAWTPEDGGKYFRTWFDPDEILHSPENRD